MFLFCIVHYLNSIFKSDTLYLNNKNKKFHFLFCFVFYLQYLCLQ